MARKIRPEELKALRKSKGISAKNAATAVERSVKSWQGYESIDSKVQIPDSVLSQFLRTFNITWPHAKVVSITAYKGGIGKSPITVAIATSFAQTGLKVAVIANDEVFRGYTNKARIDVKNSERLASKVDFFDQHDIIMYPSELLRLEEENEQRKNLPAFASCIDHEEIILRKKAATLTFEDIKNTYDLILLDLNRDLYETLAKSDKIILLVDSTCQYSPSSTHSYYKHMNKINKEKLDSMHVLFTNFSTIPSTRGQIDVTRAHKNKIFDSCLFSAHLTLKIYKEIRDLNIPIMRSRFSADYEYHIELHDSDMSNDAFCYFDTIMDIAPDSIASFEVSEVREELTEILWGRN
ncbi:ParA family protein [Pseudomonas sp. N40(2020)]|uniref:ParA family protein n=1 Tax=Pseudomonas sp. N40(2020) TaxID=2767798 RepID=UPI001656F881|nr:ParA family protein [Pseudomonas sp. N40(2020)]MBC8999854.1 ParA family protein [Pseudomonas sp. N40(2020)]